MSNVTYCTIPFSVISYPIIILGSVDRVEQPGTAILIDLCMPHGQPHNLFVKQEAG